MKKYIIFAAAVMMLALAAPAAASEGDSYQLPLNDIGSSSMLVDEYGRDYGPWYAYDSDSDTTWCEGVEGSGVGEYLELYVPQGGVVTGISILPGYYKSEELFYKNGAPTSVRISSGGYSAPRYFTDWGSNYKPGQGVPYFPLETPVVSNGVVRVTIGSVRDGWMYQDTCISEIALWGYQTSGQLEESNGYMMDPTGTYHDYEIENMTYLAQYLLKRYAYDPQDFTLDKSDLTENDYAFGLYWYQYMVADPRIKENDLFTNAVDYWDAMDIVESLFGPGTSDNVADTINMDYAESYDGNRYIFNNSGDFGDAGLWYTDTIVFGGEENGVISMVADVRCYNEETQGFPVIGTLTVRFNAEPSGYCGTYNMYSFESATLDIDDDYDDGTQHAGTYGTNGVTGVSGDDGTILWIGGGEDTVFGTSVNLNE